MAAVVDERGEQRALRLQVLVVDGGGQADEVRQSRGKGEVPCVGIQLVPFQVVAQRGAPVGQQLQHIGCREIQLLLAVAAVTMASMPYFSTTVQCPS